MGTWNISVFHMHVQTGISETTPSWILSSQILHKNRAEMSAMTETELTSELSSEKKMSFLLNGL
jgi:hypothetical protein